MGKKGSSKVQLEGRRAWGHRLRLCSRLSSFETFEKFRAKRPICTPRCLERACGDLEENYMILEDQLSNRVPRRALRLRFLAQGMGLGNLEEAFTGSTTP